MSEGAAAPAAAGLTLTRKASLNALAAGIDYGARLLVGFVVHPLLVAGLGTYGYGAWQILQRVVGYVGPGSGRTTQVLKTTIAHRQASLDFDEKRRMLGSALVVWGMFLPGLIVAGAVLGWWAPRWLEAPAGVEAAVRLAAVILVVDAILTSLVEMPRSVVEGENLAYKRLGLSTLLLLLAGALVGAAAVLGTGLAGVAAATLAGTLLTGLFFLQVARANVPWFGVSRPSRGEVGRFAGMSGWFLVWSFVMKLMRGSDVVVLGLAASVETVTTFTLTRYVPETLVNFVSIFVFSISPGLGRVIGAGEHAKARRVRAEVMGLTWLIVTAAGATLLVWNRAFVSLWVGVQHDAGRLSTLLIVLLSAQFIFIRNDANVIDLTLDLRRKVLLGVLSVSVSLAAAVALVAGLGLGIPGLCAGFLAGRMLLTLTYPGIVARHLGIPAREQAGPVARAALVTVAVFGLAIGPGSRVGAGTWPGLVAGAALTAAVLLGVCWFAGLSPQLRRGLRARLSRAV